MTAPCRTGFHDAVVSLRRSGTAGAGRDAARGCRSVFVFAIVGGRGALFTPAIDPVDVERPGQDRHRGLPPEELVGLA